MGRLGRVPRRVTLGALIAVWTAAAFYAVIGFAALLQPRKLLDPLGIRITGSVAVNEVRAVYGGLPLVFAALLAGVATGVRADPGNVLAVAIASLGMAAGRVISAVVDRSLGRFPAIFLVLEAVVGGALLVVR